jgi:hypothetical protein
MLQSANYSEHVLGACVAKSKVTSRKAPFFLGLMSHNSHAQQHTLAIAIVSNHINASAKQSKDHEKKKNS